MLSAMIGNAIFCFSLSKYPSASGSTLSPLSPPKWHGKSVWIKFEAQRFRMWSQLLRGSQFLMSSSLGMRLLPFFYVDTSGNFCISKGKIQTKEEPSTNKQIANSTGSFLKNKLKGNQTIVGTVRKKMKSWRDNDSKTPTGNFCISEEKKLTKDERSTNKQIANSPGTFLKNELP